MKPPQAPNDNLRKPQETAPPASLTEVQSTSVKEVQSRTKRDDVLSEVASTNRSRLLSIIGGTLRDQIEAEDVFQEVIEDYAESYDLGVVIESVSAWLVKVAQNKVLDRFRRKKTQNDFRDDYLDSHDASDLLSSENPGDEFERNFIKAQIVDALEALPPDQRDVFVKHELEGKTFEEISQETGVGLNTLLSRKRYATLFLRDYLKEIYDEL